MFVRLGSFEIKAGVLEALRSTYNTECVPLVRAARGNIDSFLLEPIAAGGAIIACTMWETEDDAARYALSFASSRAPSVCQWRSAQAAS